MKPVFHWIGSLRERTKSAFLGAKVLEAESRMPFKKGILETTEKRTQIVLILLLLIQISNIVVDTTSQAHQGFETVFRTGTYWIGAVCILFTALFLDIKSKKAVSYALRNAIVKSCWLFILLGSVFFCYGDMAESRTIINYTLVTLAVGILPILNITEILLFLCTYLGINIIIGVSTGLPTCLIQNMVILSILSFYGSRVQYIFAIDVFTEREHLNRTNVTLKHLSETDQLTGLLNRRGMEERLYSNIGALRRCGDTISLLMLDIDFFKEYNDKFLHMEGDRCLKKIADCLMHCAQRSTDIVARYGGEEFVIAANNMNDENLIAFAMEIKSAIEEMRITFGYYEEFPCVTLSIGIAKMDIEGKQAEKDRERFMKDLIDLADKELYNAKANGRNCISYNRVIYC